MKIGIATFTVAGDGGFVINYLSAAALVVELEVRKGDGATVVINYHSNFLLCTNVMDRDLESDREVEHFVEPVRGQPGTQAIRGWPDIPGWPGYGRPTMDPWMAWVFRANGGSRPSADGPGHPGIIHLVRNSLPYIVEITS